MPSPNQIAEPHKNIFIHIGLPKTGTTSIQYSLFHNREILQSQDFDYLSGQFGHHFCLEIGHCTFSRAYEFGSGKYLPQHTTEELFQKTKLYIERFVKSSPSHNIIISAEQLSHIRLQDDIDKLKLLIPSGCDVSIILVIRDKNDWLRSYEAEMKKHNVRANHDKQSIHCLDSDGDLQNFDALVDLYEKNFGTIKKVQYKPDMVNEFVKSLGLEIVIPEARLNESALYKRVIGRIYRLLKRTKFFYYVPK